MKRITFFATLVILFVADCLLISCGQDKKNGEKAEDTSSLLSGILDNSNAENTDEDGNTLPKATDFEYTGLDGSPVVLSDLLKENKFVVLDFWGTWCKWCIKGIPEMKKYYEKYGKKVAFVSIACYDEEAQVRKLVLAMDMPWKHILNEDNTPEKDLTQFYDIKGFPTKIIINSHGYIVGLYEGESDDFYEKLDELMK
jgi:thiol-disulfide isomerase/thioredoxin